MTGPPSAEPESWHFVKEADPAISPAATEGYLFLRPGLQLYFRRLGESGEPPVVVPNANWLSEVLVPWAERRPVLLYDPRGRGRSTSVTSGDELGLDRDVEDIEAVRRFFGLERMMLVGTSYHAAITARYAWENPDRVERLMLVSPITPFRPGEWTHEVPSVENLLHPPGVSRLEDLRRRGVDSTDRVAFCRTWLTEFLLPAQMAHPEAMKRFPLDDVCSFPNEWPDNVMRLYFEHILPGMGRWDFRPRLAEVEAPMLVLQGAQDLIPVAASRQWAAAAPNARFLVLEGAGHHPYVEQPGAFFAATRCFLDGAWPPGAEAVRGDS